MKYVLIINLTLLFAEIQCGVVKTLVETVAGEMQKVAGAIEHVANEENADSNRNGLTQTIKINSNTSQIVENDIRETVSTEIKVIKPQNLNVSEQNPENTPLQVNVDIKVVINYNKNTPTNDSTATDNKNNHEIITTNTPVTQTYTEPNIVENTTIDSLNKNEVVKQNVNNNVLFPGPMYRPITTYTDGVVVLENDDTVRSLDEFLFPDKKNNNANNDVISGCPDGMVMTATGYCLKPEKKEEQTAGEEVGVHRAAFVGGCLHGYARALDGSCQPVIED